MQIKTTHARFTGLDMSQVAALSHRLRDVRFGINSDMQVIGVDTDHGGMSVELVVRKSVQVQEYNQDTGCMTTVDTHRYRTLLFTLGSDGVVSSYGGSRDFKALAAVCKAAGCEIHTEPIAIDLAKWSSDLLEHEDTAQLSSVVFGRYFAEQHLGKWDAKPIDNRLHIEMLADKRVKSMKFKYFSYDSRVSVMVRDDATIIVTAPEEEADHYHKQHVAMMLRNAITV
jgi:hypothetical protein